MKITALVPVKMISRRCPLKNIRELNGVPLIERVVKTLNTVSAIGDIIVYCSDEDIESYIKSKHRFVKRCECLDEDGKGFHDIMQYMLTVDTIHSDFWLLQHATSPFVRKETITEMIINTVLPARYDSSFLVYKLQKFAWMQGGPLGWTRNDIPSTQLLEPLYVEASGPYIFPETLYVDRNRRVGRHPYMKVVSQQEAWDIDTEEDFKLAECIAKVNEW